MAGNGASRVPVPLGDTPRPSGTGEASVAGHRRGGATGPSRLRSVRTQLLAPIIVAMIGLAVLGTAQTTAAASAARDAQRARVLATTATSTAAYVHEIEREVAETAGLRQRGGKAGLVLVTAQRARADAAGVQYERDSRAALQDVPALAVPLQAAEEQLAKIGTARTNALVAATGAASDSQYRIIAESLLGVADALPAQIADTNLANVARVVASVASIEHFAALEREQLHTIFARGTLLPGDLTAVALVDGARQQREAEFDRISTTGETSLYTTIVAGTDVDNAARMTAGVLAADQNPAGLKVDGDAWYTAQSGLIRRISLAGLQLSDQLDAQAAAVATDAVRRAWLTAVGTVVIGLAALITAIVLAVRTARRLRKLRGAALTVARRDLPDAINSVITGTLPPASTVSGASAAAVTRDIAATNDEIGQVADAFATVHRTALRLAGEQAELRVDVTRMAEVLARRIRTLITRQLRLLDEFEREETDPEVLARLFALDHIAARLRRNGENLLVLAGGEPGRPVTAAVPVTAVVTAAASEIEDFHRVEVTNSEVAIAGPAVGDIVHLLAELLENAAMFSPPSTSVSVDARRTVDGAILRVHDGGIGIAPGRLVEINSRLAQPATLSSAAAGTMGLHVVAHLAARHGVRVQLHPTGSGITAYVALPHRVLSSPSAIGPAPVRAVYAEATVGAPVHGAPGLGTPVWEPPTPQPAAAAWFRPYLSGGTTSHPPAVGQEWEDNQPHAWTPRPVRADPAPTGGGVYGSGPLNGRVDPLTAPYSSIIGPGPAPFGLDERGLPRRRPGAQLRAQTAEHSTAATPPAPAAGPVDPDVVRARLSAFAEGVSAALRRSNGTIPAQKDR